MLSILAFLFAIESWKFLNNEPTHNVVDLSYQQCAELEKKCSSCGKFFPHNAWWEYWEFRNAHIKKWVEEQQCQDAVESKTQLLRGEVGFLKEEIEMLRQQLEIKK